MTTQNFEFDHIQSAVTIGNTLDIAVRQKSGSELSFVTIEHRQTSTKVTVSPQAGVQGYKFGYYTLILESYDRNSPLAKPSTLKTDTVTIKITRYNSCFQARINHGLSFAEQVEVFREYEPTFTLPDRIFSHGPSQRESYDCQGTLVEKWSVSPALQGVTLLDTPSLSISQKAPEKSQFSLTVQSWFSYDDSEMYLTEIETKYNIASLFSSEFLSLSIREIDETQIVAQNEKQNDGLKSSIQIVKQNPIKTSNSLVTLRELEYYEYDVSYIFKDGKRPPAFSTSPYTPWSQDAVSFLRSDQSTVLEQPFIGYLEEQNQIGTKDSFFGFQGTAGPSNYEFQCAAWTLERQESAQQVQLSVRNSLEPDLTAKISISCVFDRCLNQVAADFGEQEQASQTQRLENLLYIIGTSEKVVKVPLVANICKQPRSTEFHSVRINSAKQTLLNLTTDRVELTLNQNGIRIVRGEQEAQLHVFQDNVALADTTFDLSITSSVEEESNWSNQTDVTLTFIKAIELLESIEIENQATRTIRVANRQSQSYSGVDYEIALRMKPGSELIWVSIEQDDDAYSVIYLAPKAFDNSEQYGKYQVILESFDHKSQALHPIALKTDLMVVNVTRPLVCRQPASTIITLKPQILVFKEYGLTIQLPDQIFRQGPDFALDYDCQGSFVEQWSIDSTFEDGIYLKRNKDGTSLIINDSTPVANYTLSVRGTQSYIDSDSQYTRQIDQLIIVKSLFSSEYLFLEAKEIQKPENYEFKVFQQTTTSKKASQIVRTLSYDDYDIRYRFKQDKRPLALSDFPYLPFKVNSVDLSRSDGAQYLEQPLIGDLNEVDFIPQTNSRIFGYPQQPKKLKPSGYDFYCPPWTLQRSNQTEVVHLRIASSRDPELMSTLNATCAYSECSNQIAAAQNDLPSAKIIQDIDDLVYTLSTATSTLQISLIEEFCGHKRQTRFYSATHRFQDGKVQKFESQIANKLFRLGVRLSILDNMAQLSVQSDDLSLNGSILDITLISFSEQEPTWFNKTNVLIHFVQPSCLSFQEKLSSEIQPMIKISAAKGTARTESVSLSQLIRKFEQSFDIPGYQQPCGRVQYALVNAEEWPNLTVDRKIQVLTFEPIEFNEEGIYNTESYLEFSLTKYPSRSWKVFIQVEVKKQIENKRQNLAYDVEINESGMLKLYFETETQAQSFEKSLHERQIEFFISPTGGQSEESVKFQTNFIDSEKSQRIVQLHFLNPDQISADSEPNLLQIISNDEELQEPSAEYDLFSLKRVEFSIALRTQKSLQKDVEVTESNANTSAEQKLAITIVVICSLLLALSVLHSYSKSSSESFHEVLVMFMNFQTLVLLMIIEVQLSKRVSSFYQELAKLVNLKSTWGFVENDQTSTFSQQAKNVGFESNLVIFINQGVYILMSILVLTTLTLKLMIDRIASESPLGQICYKAYDKLHWSGFCQTIEYVYMPLAIGSALNARELSFDTTIHAISSLLALCNAIVIIFYPVWLMNILKSGWALEVDSQILNYSNSVIALSENIDRQPLWIQEKINFMIKNNKQSNKSIQTSQMHASTQVNAGQSILRHSAQSLPDLRVPKSITFQIDATKDQNNQNDSFQLISDINKSSFVSDQHKFAEGGEQENGFEIVTGPSSEQFVAHMALTRQKQRPVTGQNEQHISTIRQEFNKKVFERWIGQAQSQIYGESSYHLMRRGQLPDYILSIFITAGFYQKLSLVTVIVALKGKPFFQIFGSLAVQLLYLILMLHSDVFKTRTCEVFGELTILLTIYFLVPCTDGIMTKKRDDVEEMLGSILIALATTYFAIVLCKVTISMILHQKNRFKASQVDSQSRLSAIAKLKDRFRRVHQKTLTNLQKFREQWSLLEQSQIADQELSSGVVEASNKAIDLQSYQAPSQTKKQHNRELRKLNRKRATLEVRLTQIDDIIVLQGAENAISVSDVSQIEAEHKDFGAPSVSVSNFSHLAAQKDMSVSVSDLSALAGSLDPIHQEVSVSDFSFLKQSDHQSDKLEKSGLDPLLFQQRSQIAQEIAQIKKLISQAELVKAEFTASRFTRDFSDASSTFKSCQMIRLQDSNEEVSSKIVTQIKTRPWTSQ